MRLALKRLHLSLHKSIERIDLPGVIYFFGPIGSGKSSIGRLIDFCLGGRHAWTPALQAEMVSAALEMSVNDVPVTLHRDRDSAQVMAAWQDGDETLQVLIPTKTATHEVLPDSGVEVLSDLLFHLAKEEPPYVRRRKGTPDERLERLSFRDLFRFCYLDQEGMDNVFFRLDSDNYAIRAKSVDALRYVLGYRTEQVAEYESRLQEVREKRLGLLSGVQALSKALIDAGLDDINAYDAKIELTKAEIERARAAAQAARQQRSPAPHAAEELRAHARRLAQEQIALEQASADIDVRIGELERHANELQMLSVRFQRTASARMVLGGVDFSSCPRCTQTLPSREAGLCLVCGQPEHITEAVGALGESVVNGDLRARQMELKETLARMREQRRIVQLRAVEIAAERSAADHSLEVRLREYDSAFLSQALQHERVVATLEQRLDAMLRYRKLPDVLQEQQAQAEVLKSDEAELRAKLEAAKKWAFNDRKNVELLGELFLDCLVRAKFPDVRSDYRVEIDPATFYPRIPLGANEALVVLSFDNAGSGGMKALFKTCYALALHRVCARAGDSRLPPVLIIDTPTKNVSSVENPEVIAAFFRLVYELAAGELVETQFVIIDNEFNAVPDDIDLPMSSRHMVNGDRGNPPLIPYLVGDFS
ncbi:hypothetical protein [Ralstonia pseudosolanacearum]|uniref:hypothetical protein n=1 Tax=Ralstonia pseudosolanacearum TaxID=1310165 RepID=UPI0026760DD5|nr:hypothetical protein [Ralstonia pseudosolanacearum]MDO3608529.1 hypothetical protein [Ralstonia pseudosolanacearum]MDO3613922.1 hypothetical protein [Ralstonia pseudosolanacearum]